VNRDLTLASRVAVRGSDGGVATVPVHLERPLLRIPSLSIHLFREIREQGSSSIRNGTSCRCWAQTTRRRCTPGGRALRARG
jgi:aspartyl aminopeptidase